MICNKCGTENLDNSRFCENCGQALTKEEGIIQNTTVNECQNVEGTTVNKKRNLVRNIIIGVAAGTTAVIILIVILIGVFVNNVQTINLDKYVTVEESGYDGYGKATVKIDWDAIEDKYGDKLSYTKKAKKEYSSVLNYMEPIDLLKLCVSINLDETTGLSNGDDINYTWTLSENINEYFQYEIKAKNGEYIVKNLEKVGEFDPFENLEVYFEGVSENATIKYEYTGTEFGYYDFECSKNYDLSNGDVVIISIDDANTEYYINKFGMIPEKYQMEYEVSGLDEYIGSYSDIDDETIKYIQLESEDMIYSYVANEYSSGSELSDLKYEGYIFACYNESNKDENNNNKLYCIYSGCVYNSNDKFEPTIVYFPVSYSSILKQKDGIIFNGQGIIGKSYFENSSYSTKGYINSMTCYQNIISKYSDSYDVELGGEFKNYDKYENVSKLNDVTDKYKSTITDDAKKVIEDEIESNYLESTVVTGLKYVGEYLLVAKNQSSDYISNNKYVVVFSATVSSTEDNFEETTVYFPIEYDGLVKITDDKYIYGSRKGILGRSSFPDGRYYTKGYISEKEMYSDIVTANRANYKYEISTSLDKLEK